MNYAAIKKTDVANGPGIRVSLFVSGCTHGCKGCFNSEAWDFKYGREYTKETETEILEALAPEHIRGLSVLGGEPMEPQNRGTVLTLLRKVRQRFPRKDIWCYTGYDYENDLLRWVREENVKSALGSSGGESTAVMPCHKEQESAVGGFDSKERVGVIELGSGERIAVGGFFSSEETAVAKSGCEEYIPGEVAELLSLIDVLVDGEFVEERKNLRLAFRGSENQRLIDLKESLRQGKVICLSK